MRILLLGGTAWLGRAIAAAAVARGHEVTALARGSGPVPDGVTLIRADRDEPGAYDAVARVRWDAVIDLSRQPGQVRRSVRALRATAAAYLFVSSSSVYADQSQPGDDESAPLLPPLIADVMPSMESYGSAKVACEQAVAAEFGGAALIVRPGLIGGPGDASGRSTYYPSRFASPSTEDGAVLVPDLPELPTQVIDVRDLASWLVGAAEAGIRGVLNAAGDALPLREHLKVAWTVAGHTGPVVAVPSAWLQEHGVQEWMGPRSLPLWLADPGWAGMNARSTAAARAAGLVTRPLTETLFDGLRWQREQTSLGSGLSPADERELLAQWRSDVAAG